MSASAAVVLSWPGREDLASRPVCTRAVPEDVELTAFLRRTARDMRVCARIDLDRACQLIAAERSATAERYATALIKAVCDHAKSPVRVYQLGSVETSHFEQWFARLVRSFQSGDDASARLLIGSYITPEGHRRVSFLASGLSKVMDAAV